MGTHFFVHWGEPKLVERLAGVCQEGQLIYELSEKETVYLASNVAEGLVSEFIGGSPSEGPPVKLDRIRGH